jgi:hypothetical protein
MTVVERLRKESEARTATMKTERTTDKKIEDKTFGRSVALNWELVYEKDRS